MNDLNCLEPRIFLIYIGFALASFAFLCNYLSFPKSLLQDLSNIICNKPPRIRDSSLVNTDRRRQQADHVICYFYEIDVITFAILLFLVFSAMVVLVLLSYRLGMICLEYTNHAILVLSISHFFSHCVLVIKSIRGHRSSEEWGSRDIYLLLDTLFAACHLAGILYIVYVIKSGTLLFLFLIGILLVLYMAYLIPLARRLPVTNMLNLWKSLGNETPDCEN